MDTRVDYKGEEISLCISPYKIERICNVSEVKNDDSMFDLVNIEKEIKDREERLVELLRDADKKIYQEISLMDSAFVKQAIKAKQSVSKRRFSKLTDEQKALFSGEILELINKCHEIDDDINQLKENKTSVYLQNQKKSVAAIRSALRSDKNYYNGLVMSVYNDEFYKNIQELKSYDDIKMNKKNRNTLYSLRNYYNRMTRKPSPFSTFVLTQVLFTDKSLDSGQEISGFFHPKIYLNELVVKSLENQLLKDNTFMDEFYIKINPTLQVNENYYEFLNVDVHNAKMYYSENVIKVKKNARIDRYIELLADGKNLHLSDLVARIKRTSEIECEDVKIIKEILALDEVGILYKNFNINHQDYNNIQQIINLLEKRQYGRYKNISYALKDIVDKINTINTLTDDIELKRTLKEKIFDDIKIIFDKYPKEAFDFDYVKKNVLYENNTLPVIKHEKLISQNIQKNFYLAEKLYRIFDNNYVQRIMFRNIFRKHHSLDEKVNVLDFYKSVSEEYKKSIELLLKNDADIKQIEQLQIKFLDLIKSKKSKEKDYINILDEDIEDIYFDAPKIMDDKFSYGVYYQKINGDYVINNISPGMGRHVIRYVSDLYDDEKREFIKKYKNHVNTIENDRIVFTDIGTSLGISINKHYEVLKKAFGYPKSMYENEVKASELNVVYDKKSEAVKLVDNENVVYESTPIGFLFPRISPGFYSFLSTFSNSRGASMSFWDRYYDEIETNVDDIVHYPRIVVNHNVIISRETWKLKGNIFKDIEDTEDSYVVMIEKIFDKNHLPKRFFARKSSDINALKEIGKSTAEWESIITNNKLRKPQYFDLNNYLDYGIFVSFINTNKELTVTMQEVLPDSKTTVEHLIEINEIK